MSNRYLVALEKIAGLFGTAKALARTGKPKSIVSNTAKLGGMKDIQRNTPLVTGSGGVAGAAPLMKPRQSMSTLNAPK